MRGPNDISCRADNHVATEHRTLDLTRICAAKRLPHDAITALKPENVFCVANYFQSIAADLNLRDVCPERESILLE
jgi:hypothetical protein